MDQIEDGAPQWQIEGAKARDLVKAVFSDNAQALAAASDRTLWAADVVAERERDMIMQAPGLGLAGLAARKNAVECLSYLLGSEAWLAAYGSGGGGLFKAESGLAAVAARFRSEKTIASLASRSQELAWMAAALCAPGEPWAENQISPPGVSGAKRANPGKEFPAGFKAAVLTGLTQGPPESELSKSLAREALTRALEEPWIRSGWSLACGEAIEGALSRGWVDEGVAASLSFASCKMGENHAGAHERLWETTIKFWSQAGAEIYCSPKALGEAAGSRTLSSASWRSDGPMINFPERMDPAWAAAALARQPEDLEAVARMAATPGRMRAAPICESDGVGVEHPLGPIWDSWSHSKRAGFALPQKPLEAAWKKSQALFAPAKRAAPKDALDRWEKTANEVMGELRSGRIPESFDAWGTARPTWAIAQERGDLKRVLTPLAWAMSTGRLSSQQWEDRFKVVACAQSLLGFSIEDSIGQLEMAGSTLPTVETLAAAEAEILRWASRPSERIAGGADEIRRTPRL